MADATTFARAYHGDEGLDEFHRRAVRAVALGLLGLAFLITWVSAADDAQPLPLVGGLMLTAGLMLAAARWRPGAATAVLIAGATATLAAGVGHYPEAGLTGYLGLIALAATATGGWRAGLAAAVAGTLVVAGARGLAPAAVSAQAATQAGLQIWISLLLASLMTRPLQAVVDWAWANYAWAGAQADEARRHRAELARQARSLSAAYDNLDRRNAELAEARAAAEAARRLKAEFAAAVGHELRTPVNLIVGFSELLLEADRAGEAGRALPPALRRDVEVVHRNACHISQLVDDILDLSQVDARRMALHPSPIVLAEVVDEAAASVRPLCERAGLSLALHVPATLPAVMADPLRVRQIVINLLYNAVRFTPRGGLTVSARRAGPDVVVAVVDTGIGIPADHLPRVFEEFRQVEPGDRARGGSGLGLAVCRRFVELHGGRIWVASAPGAGSTFYFSLPVDGAPAPGPRPPAAPPPARRERRRLAVVDRDGDVARILRRYLDGHEIGVAETPARVIEHVRAGARALLVASPADHRAVRRLARRHPEVAAVPVIECPLRTRASLTRLLGVADYLMKPVSRQQLAQAFRRLGRPIRRLVVVEDDPEMRDLLARFARRLLPGRRIVAAGDGVAGLRLIRDERPDVVLLDLLLPELDGAAVVRLLRADPALRQTAVIVVSAKGLSEEVVAARLTTWRAGGFSVAETVACLSAILDGLTGPPRDTAGAP